jgi:hypothetical protein
MEPIEAGRVEGGISMDQCIRDCIACYELCTSCISHCLSQGGKHAGSRHITLMSECAQICNLSSAFMLQKGEFAFELCQLCAKICNACAESCITVDVTDGVMMKCADVCRRCADSCRSMAH